MARLSRTISVVPGEIYHIIARGNGGMTVFHLSENYEDYLDLLREASQKYGVEIFHYVLMPNHIHLLVKPAEELSQFMHIIQMTYAKRFCRDQKFLGHVWQGRYKNLLISSDAYLFACGNYIEMNPVRAGLTSSPSGWEYSSYGVYANGEMNPLVTIDPFYENLGRDQNERQYKYRESIALTRISTPVP